jgi:hypothetical protein
VRERRFERDRTQREQRAAPVGGLGIARDRSDERVERGALETRKRAATRVTRDAVASQRAPERAAPASATPGKSASRIGTRRAASPRGSFAARTDAALSPRGP